jgi:hypothetical protein
MDYYKKYIKYKNKYLYFKNKIGGYYLSSRKPEHFLGKILEIITQHTEYFDIDPIKRTKIKNFDETLEFMMENKSYNSIIDYLLKKYYSDELYDETFIKKNDDIIFDTKGRFQYHINFGALMFLSFIIELELFTLFHSIIEYNTVSFPEKNNVASLWDDTEIIKKLMATKTRIYNDNIDLPLIKKLEYFATSIDKLFDEFMEKLISIISLAYSKPKNEILMQIVPIEHKKHIANIYDYIYIDWKERLIKFIGSDIKSMLNQIIKVCMKDLEIKNLEYITDATGFFSYMFLNNPYLKNKFYGSCITYSNIELYIMSRLHINAINLRLLLENERKMSYFFITERVINKHVTHWATTFPFSTYPLIFRSMFDKTELNFKDNKTEMLKSLLYPIFDNYIAYMYKYTKYNKKQIQQIKKILLFIQKRIETIENYNYKILDDNQIIQYFKDEITNKSKLILINISRILQQENTITVLQKNIRDIIISTIDNMKNTIQFKIIFFIFQILRLSYDEIVSYINIQNKDGITILHIAIINKVNKEIIIALIEKGANVNLQNNFGLTALHIAIKNKVNKEIIIALIANGANVDLQDEKGLTALHLAIMYGAEKEIIYALLDKGANVNLQNKKKQTALSIAIKRDIDKEIINSLLEK